MALSITNPLSSIHIDPNFRFYKLSINSKTIIDCDDKTILNHFQELNYLHCSLCLTQEKDSKLIYEHLTSETHALNGMRLKNYVGFLVEEIAALVICPRKNINYFFYVKYHNFPYDTCLGIADGRFVTLMNKPVDENAPESKANEFSATLGDFDLKPESIYTRYSLTAMIELAQTKSTLLPRNFLLYELKYSQQNAIKYKLKAGNVWHYLEKNTIAPEQVICSCSQVMKPSLFTEHCTAARCIKRAALYCHLCKTLIIFSNANFLTHMHNDQNDVCKLMENFTINESSSESSSIEEFDWKDLMRDDENVSETSDKCEEQRIHEVLFPSRTVDDIVPYKSKCRKKKNSPNITLSKSILGEYNQQTAEFQTLLDTFRVHLYNLSTKELNVYSLKGIPDTYDLLFMVCCVCHRIILPSSFSTHFKNSRHTDRMIKNSPSAIFFPEVGGLVIGKFEDSKYLDHVVFDGMALLNNIIVDNSDSIFMVFYNTGLKTKLSSNLQSIVRNNIKITLGHEDNYKLNVIKLTDNSDIDNTSKVISDKFIIFEFVFTEGGYCKEDLLVMELDTFLMYIKRYTFKCLVGRKDIYTFSDHLKIKDYKFYEACLGLICHKCNTFTIHPVGSSLRHNHVGFHEKVQKNAEKKVLTHTKSNNLGDGNSKQIETSAAESSCTFEEVDLKKETVAEKETRLKEEQNTQDVYRTNEIIKGNKKAKKKNGPEVTLTKAIFGVKNQHAAFRRLLYTFKVHVYSLSTKELEMHSFISIPETYDVLFLVCCLCERLLMYNIDISKHFITDCHSTKMIQCEPAAVFFPDVGGLIIGKLEDFVYLDHLLFVGMPLLSNIIVADTDSIFMVFYNNSLRKQLLSSNLHNVIRNNIKLSLGHEDNFKLNCIQLTDNSNSCGTSNLISDKFVIFEFFLDEDFLDEDFKEGMQVLELKKFLIYIKRYAFSCMFGRKKFYDSFSQHLKIKDYKFYEKCFGFICHKCMTFTIHPIESCLRHQHIMYDKQYKKVTNLVEQKVITPSFSISSDGNSEQVLKSYESDSALETSCTVNKEVDLKNEIADENVTRLKEIQDIQTTSTITSEDIMNRQKPELVKLSKAIFAEICHENADFQRLLDTLQVYIYELSTNKFEIYRLNEIPEIYNLSFLVCCICEKLFMYSLDIPKHFSTECHKTKIIDCKPTAIFFPDVGGLLIGKLEDFKYLDHVLLLGMPLLVNISVAVSDSIFMIFYNNNKFKNKTLCSNLYSVIRNNIKVSLGHEDNHKLNVIKLAENSNSGRTSNLISDKFIIFEFFLEEDEDFKEGLQVLKLDTFLNYVKYLKFHCMIGRKDINTFSEHIKVKDCKFYEKCLGLICHKCNTFTLYPVQSCLRHNHISPDSIEYQMVSDEVEQKFITHSKASVSVGSCKQMEKSTISDSSIESTSKLLGVDFKEIVAEIETQLKEEQKNQQVQIKNDIKRQNKKTFNKKFDTQEVVMLSKSILGEMSEDNVDFQRLLHTFQVHIYQLSTKQLKTYALNEIPETYNLSFLVCCICEKIFLSSCSLSRHFYVADHTTRMIECSPVGIYFPDVEGLIIGKLEMFNYLQHILLDGMPLLSNIIVEDSESIFIVFYNNNLKKKLPSSNLANILCNNIKSSFGHEDNNRVNFIKLINNSNNDRAPVLFSDKFIIFEFFCEVQEEHFEGLQEVKLDTFLIYVKDYTFTCVPCGRKKIKYGAFSKHIKASGFKCYDKCLGLLCHKCKSFSINPIQECLRHNHLVSDKKVKKLETFNGGVKKVEIDLLETISIKEYFNTVNPVCSYKEICEIKTLTDYLLKALPLKSNVNNVDFVCNSCTEWSCKRIKDMIKHYAFHMKLLEESNSNEYGYGFLCDICNVFLYDKRREVLDEHIKTTHPDYVKKDTNFDLVQDENNIIVNLITGFSLNLLESYIEKISNLLEINCENITIFCMVCFKTFDYSLVNFHNHIMQCSHQPRTNDHFSSYCKFCKLLLYNDDIKWITNHFNYHSHLTKTKIKCIDDNQQQPQLELSQTNLHIQKEKAVLNKILLFSSCLRQGKRNKLIISQFEFMNNIEAVNIFKNLKNMFGKNILNFHYKCLCCSYEGLNEYDCNAHFLTKFHHLDNKSSMYLITVCTACSVILIGLSTIALYDHYESGSHFINSVHEDIVLNQEALAVMSDDDRLLLGYLTKECEETFSSIESYNKFLESNLIEYRRAERGLLKLCNSLSNDIRRVLVGTYPKAGIYFFGSRLSGLAKINSDIDVFIDVGNIDLERLVPLFKIIPGLFNITKVILGAKVPIIKLDHKNTGLSCDISCRDGYGVYNTHLIRLYINLDERVYKLCATILEWAKMNEIRGSPRFTSYSLSWMVLFFLMQPDINLVPSVKWLQDRFQGNRIVINGWNCSFLSDINLIKAQFKPTNNSITLYELIYKFFKFYSLLNIEKITLFTNTGDIISNRFLTRSGHKLPLNLRKIFFDNNGEKTIYKHSTIRIIDPFIFNCNIVQNIRKHELKLFQSLCVHTLHCLNWAKPVS